MPKKIPALIAGILLIVSLLSNLIACTDKKNDINDIPVLSVSIEPQRRMLEEIAGDSFRVVTLLPPGANPETFEPSVNQRVDIDKSLAFFTTGNLPYEKTIARSLRSGVKIVDTSKGIDLIHGTHQHHYHDANAASHDHHHHGDADPHTWTSVKNARIMLLTMLNQLIELRPEGKDYFTARYQAADARLDSLDKAFARQFDSNSPTAFAVWHPSLSYFARDYGLEQISVGQESKEISPRQLRQIADHAKERNVTIFFFQKEFDSRQAENINREIGSTMVTIDPMAYDWEKQLAEIVNQLAPAQ